MLIRSVVVTVVVLVVVGWLGCVHGSDTQDALTLDSTGGYFGVVVALSDALSDANCTHYIQNIKVTSRCSLPSPTKPLPLTSSATSLLIRFLRGPYQLPPRLS